MNRRRSDDAVEQRALLPNESAPDQPETSPMYHNLFTGVAPLAQFGILVFVLMVWSIVLAQPLTLFSVHPLSNSLGLLVLSNSIMILQPTSTQSQKAQGANMHGVLNIIATCLFATAATAIIKNKISHSAAHFTSWHGVFGITTYSLLIVQGLVGSTQFWFPHLYGSEARAKKIYKYHRQFGYLISLVATLTALLGTQSTWMKAQIDMFWPWFIAIFLVWIGIYPRIKLFKLGISR